MEKTPKDSSSQQALPKIHLNQRRPYIDSPHNSKKTPNNDETMNSLESTSLKSNPELVAINNEHKTEVPEVSIIKPLDEGKNVKNDNSVKDKVGLHDNVDQRPAKNSTKNDITNKRRSNLKDSEPPIKKRNNKEKAKPQDLNTKKEKYEKIKVFLFFKFIIFSYLGKG